MFALPSVAIAEKPEHAGGGGKNTAPGQMKKATEGGEGAAAQGKGKAKAKAKAKDETTPEDESVEGSGTPESGDEGEPKGKAKGKSKEKGASAGQGYGKAKRSEDASGTTEQKRTGIENALDRIAANIEKAEQKVAEGTKKAVPPGLLAVYEKFAGWLGLELDEPDGPDEAGDSHEETGTPEPGDETSPSVEPTVAPD
jgi:hypothetical protein